MAAQGNDSAEEAEAEAVEVEAEGEAEAQGSGEPLSAAVNRHRWPWGDGAEQDWRVSGQLSRLLPLLLEAQALRGQPLYLPCGAFGTAAPSDASSRQSAPGSDGEDTDDSEDCEGPRSAAAMLNIFRSIPTQMVGRPGEARSLRAAALPSRAVPAARVGNRCGACGRDSV